MRKILLVVFTVLLTPLSFSQFTEFHPELTWYTLKSDNVYVHFHDGAERTARVVLKIANEVWGPITSLYNYQPERVHYVIKDIDDYSNGATYFFDNKIEIWTSALDFDLRGSHNWLRNVISHEFTHLVQIQASLKAKRTIPAFYLQWLNYEDERRPDILYGFPNVIVSYPIAMINVPAWFAEGTAQYMRRNFDYDNWDSHRDMILRSYVLDNNMLTWNQMGQFEKTSLGNESVYNSGFALTLYIAQKYGEDKLRLISERLGVLKNFTIDEAIQDVLGISGIQLYNEWKDFLTTDYNNRISKVLLNTVEGKKVRSEGFGNFYPGLFEGSSSFLYVSNKNNDYFGLSSIYLADSINGEDKLLVSGVRSAAVKIPGKNAILYSKLTEENPNRSNVHDIFIYDLDNEEEKRITYNLRANNPTLSEDGKNIVFVTQRDGTTNLALIDLNGENYRALTNYQNGEQVYNPRFSPDGSYIYFDYSYHHGRDLFRIPISGGEVEPVLTTSADERNVSFVDNVSFVYSSDRTGIFNLYLYNLRTKESVQLTNVKGGAFYPAVAKDGSIFYSGYTSEGYKIYHISPSEMSSVVPGMDYISIKNPPLQKDSLKGDFDELLAERLKNFNDYSYGQEQKEKYSGAFSKLTFFPLLRYDNYNTSNKFYEKLKPGVYVTSSDMLNRYSVFAGATVNTRMERDLFFMFEYKNKLPLLYDIGIKPELSLELYNISRKADVDIFIDEFPVIKTDVSYNLFEVDVIAHHKIISREHDLFLKYAFSRYSATIGSFIFPGTATLYPTSSDPYLIGGNFEIKYRFDAKLPYIDSDINPVGSDMEIKYNYELNKFNPDGEYTVDDGILKPLYKNFNFHRIETNLNSSFRVGKASTIFTKFRYGNILGSEVPDFFDFYLGGLIGMKAYPFYAISGNEIVWLHAGYRFALWKNIDSRFMNFYIDKIFFSIYGDIGNAWTKTTTLKDMKKGAGAEVRFALNSYYLFPTSIFINASYGFDSFSREFRGKTVTYGREVRMYAGILFGFDF